jgi:hypothetical protein
VGSRCAATAFLAIALAAMIAAPASAHDPALSNGPSRIRPLPPYAPPPPSSSARGALTGAEIEAVRAAGLPLLASCWPGGRTSIRVVIDMTIEPTGRVAVVRSRGDGPRELHECIELAAAQWVFPASGHETSVSLPMTYSHR